MDNPWMVYFIATFAMLVYFAFCIATTWLFAKLVLRAMPQGKTDGGNKKDKDQAVDEVPERGDG